MRVSFGLFKMTVRSHDEMQIEEGEREGGGLTPISFYGKSLLTPFRNI